MTTADDVLQRVDAHDVELIRLVFVNNSGVPRGRVLDPEGLEGALSDGTNLTHAMQSINALDRLVPGGRYGPAGEVRVVPDPETFTVLPYDERAALLLSDANGRNTIRQSCINKCEASKKRFSTEYKRSCSS